MKTLARLHWHVPLRGYDVCLQVGYEAIGIIDSSLRTVGVWAEASKQDTPKACVDVFECTGVREFCVLARGWCVPVRLSRVACVGGGCVVAAV